MQPNIAETKKMITGPLAWSNISMLLIAVGTNNLVTSFNLGVGQKTH